MNMMGIPINNNEESIPKKRNIKRTREEILGFALFNKTIEELITFSIKQ